MPVTAADLKFFASQRLTDNADGGGPRSSTIIQSGLVGNLFPAVSAADRSAGRTSLRKFFPSLTNADRDALGGASLVGNEVPTDSAVSIAVFAFGGAMTTRAEAEAGLLAWHRRPNMTISTVGITNAQSIDWLLPLPNSDYYPKIGEIIGIVSTGSGVLPPALSRAVVTDVGPVFTGVIGAGPGTGPQRTIQLDRPHGLSVGAGAALRNLVTDTEVRPYGSCAVSGSVSNGATSLTLSAVTARLANATGSGLDYGPLAYCSGLVAVVRSNDTCTLWHEDITTAANGSPGGTVDVGRTLIDQFAVVDNNGVEVARFLNGGPTPGGNIATVNFATGVLTWAAGVTTLAQPLRVRHRISHRSLVTVSGTSVTLATATTRAFPSGSVLSSHMPLGDVAASVGNVFSQQAWNNVWSSTRIGNPVALMYSGDPVVTNQGAETDRYAIVFGTVANQFVCYSERLGLIGSGNTTVNFSPLNPATGAPLFTLLASNWAPDILVGSALRFDVTGATPPAWALRCVAPSSPSGTTSIGFRLHGSV